MQSGENQVDRFNKRSCGLSENSWESNWEGYSAIVWERGGWKSKTQRCKGLTSQNGREPGRGAGSRPVISSSVCMPHKDNSWTFFFLYGLWECTVYFLNKTLFWKPVTTPLMLLSPLALIRTLLAPTPSCPLTHTKHTHTHPRPRFWTPTEVLHVPGWISLSVSHSHIEVGQNITHRR